MQLSKEQLAFAFAFILLSSFIYNHGRKTVQKVIDYLDPKMITSEDFQWIITRPNPCDHLRNVKLLFTLPRSEINPALEKLAEFGCFDSEVPFLNIIDAAIAANNENSLLFSLISLGHNRHPQLMSTVMYKCAKKKFYNCVETILIFDPLMEYEGKNVVHIATFFDDEDILDLAPKGISYLHRRDNTDSVPSKYIRSMEMLTRIIKRFEVEIERSPYPKELAAHSVYLTKTMELGFATTLRQRIEKMFINVSIFKADNRLQLEIPRNSIFKFSYEQLHYSWFSWYTPGYYGKSLIKFIGEQGVDMSGVTNDWISSLVEIFFKANPDGDAASFTAPLFRSVSEDSSIYEPTALYPASVYKFAGSVVALALKHKISTRIEFVPSLYRMILGVEPYRLDDLKVQSPDIYKNLNSLHKLFNRDGRIEGFDFKNIKDVDNYIELYSKDLLYKKHKYLLQAFAEGFRSKIPRKISKYLDLMDLKDILRGSVAITRADFEKSIQFLGFTSNGVLESSFFQTLDQLSQAERFKFIKFVTGRHGLPFGGLTELPQKIRVQFRTLPKGHLPTASTCSSVLVLPVFDSVAELKLALIKAIENCDTIDRV